MSVQYEVVTPVGVTAYTTDTEALAKAYVLARKKSNPGLRVDRVETITIRTSIYKPRMARTA